MEINILSNYDKKIVNEIVEIHLSTFKGFFLTFMGRGFLRQMYSSYLLHNKSNIIVAIDSHKVVGFLAYSYDMSGLYKHMIKHRLVQFAWYSLGAFFRKPEYVELASIGVNPECKSSGIGTMLIDKLKKTVDFDKYRYITLETDAINNDAVNSFYCKNGFVLIREFETPEGRKMNEYHFERSKVCAQK